MAEFYEFHGSDLLGIEQKDGHLILRIDAYKHVWPEGLGVGLGTAWTQTIEITVDEASRRRRVLNIPQAYLHGKPESEKHECPRGGYRRRRNTRIALQGIRC